MAQGGDIGQQVDRLFQEWHAGAEVELFTKFGVYGTEEEKVHLGIGDMPREVSAPMRGRFRSTPDELGLIGHRLAWAGRNLAFVLRNACVLTAFGVLRNQAIGKTASAQRQKSAARERSRRIWAKGEHREGRSRNGDADAAPPSGVERTVDDLCRVGHRAAAFLKERLIDGARAEDQDAARVLRQGLSFLASMIRERHGKLPLVDLWCLGDGDNELVMAANLMEQIEEQATALAGRRNSRKIKDVRRWIKTAPLRVAHRATKQIEVVTTFSASAKKDHRGAQNAQRAADEGIEEWGDPWQGRDGPEEGETVLRAMEAMAHVAKHEVITLRPIGDEAIMASASKMNERTGVGSCGLRPRHVTLLTRDAREALGRILMIVEWHMRWPEALRQVIAVAIGKKTGGARLIGLASSIYRLWARVRLTECSAILESRIDRPFLTAAPGKGAARAAFEVSRVAEVAAAKGQSVAGTALDIAQFYEHIAPDEYAKAARTFGLPQCIVSLCVHLYLGARRIRVGGCFSKRVHPTRSILAGCSWATIFIRILIIQPAEALLAQIRRRIEGWGVEVDLNFYVDDGLAITRGSLDATVIIHTWLTRLILHWVKNILKKQVARHKLQVIGSSREVRARLRANLQEHSSQVASNGDVLGVDCALGGAARVRPVSRARLRKAARRRRLLRWWRRMGGDANAVARGGIIPSVTYGGESIGIRASTMRDMRRTMAAASRVKAGGSSTTARLAIGGQRYGESDPQVLLGNLPLIAVASKLWDDPRCRSDHVFAWRSARARLIPTAEAKRWAAARGPVDSALIHLMEVGAEWARPFEVTVAGTKVHLLRTPPKQVARLVQLHNRRWLDHGLLKRLGQRINWDTTEVEHYYQHGIDWQLVRDLLQGKRGDLSAGEKRTMEVLVCGAFWPESRRWNAGLGPPTGTCMRCVEQIGDERHVLVDCGAALNEVLWARIKGRDVGDEAMKDIPGLAPLLLAGLPPRTRPVIKANPEFTEGNISLGSCGTFYGDASGYGSGGGGGGQPDEVVTWSVLQLRRDAETDVIGMSDPLALGGRAVCQQARGVCEGLFPSVPRGELMALVQFLRGVRVPAKYVGDCKGVIDGARLGVPPRLTSSGCFHADLWRDVRHALRDHGPGIEIRKTKAHRSRTQAANDEDDGLEQWEGNQAADEAAKSLARGLWGAGEDDRAARRTADLNCLRLMRRTAITAHFAIQSLGRHATEKRKREGRRRHKTQDGKCGDHSLVPWPRGKGQWCQQCRLITTTKSSWMALAGKPCRGDIAAMVHPSHSMRWSGRVMYCGRCGWYTSRIPRALKRPCHGAPASVAARNVLRRLRLGMPPTTAQYHADLGDIDANAIYEAEQRRDRPGHQHQHHQHISQDARDVDQDSGRREGDAFTGEGSRHADAAVRVDPRPPSRCSGHRARTRRGGGETGDNRGRQEATGDTASHGAAQNEIASGARTGTLMEVAADAMECRDLPTQPWTRRACGKATWASAACHLCGNSCRLRCRACSRAICIDCVKAARACESGTRAVDLPHAS